MRFCVYLCVGVSVLIQRKDAKHLVVVVQSSDLSTWEDNKLIFKASLGCITRLYLRWEKNKGGRKERKRTEEDVKYSTDVSSRK